VITGVHAVVYSPAAEEVRAFFADVLNSGRLMRAVAGSFSHCRRPSWLFILLMAAAVTSCF